ncbi:MAG TPA: YeeE/YedE family protein [Cyanobacteria bacterium UBA11149]|nr:YeeE/YedE family protein [Cyanobacteria bacterium UBA11367]HBE56435.1 YeeE/YedE family protein [Cyanobacteria bacterium UBA11366]HBK64812.1 YeeE/YedE family protein [Cyanobacteria bacterium UBA11166]HBR77283.1 YeeE/YedE family protein [Cyanobacteria bacterium UBA11159]HBS70422.1 YeeE/YedE family protein [Cyanobacteria bacterium UBA11153]HBW87766.1 YeeE/YedE family protein [Cyanobacteria bacterium UBA11149]HCA94763.1 YeeE/YedE family protein [Cyanobacteria bacterium UBA9226]
MTEFNWLTALFGGVLIGISATLLLAFNGRIAGISGMVNGAISFSKKEVWRWLFLLGMLLGGAIYEYGLASQATPTSTFAPWAMILGGFLVGFGTRMGSGCTSGHGVCGLGRLSLRSLVAVVTFLITAILTVFTIRHVLHLGV